MEKPFHPSNEVTMRPFLPRLGLTAALSLSSLLAASAARAALPTLGPPLDLAPPHPTPRLTVTQRPARATNRTAAVVASQGPSGINAARCTAGGALVDRDVIGLQLRPEHDPRDDGL